MAWKKRSAMTFKFKGRERRALYWKKSVYKMWYKFAKVSPLAIPAEFGNLDDFDNFEQWWRHPDYGFELFCEPAEKDPLEVVDSVPEKAGKGELYLRIDLNAEPQKLKLMFSTLLKRRQNPTLKQPPSQARFQPSRPMKYMRIGVLEQCLETWELRQKGLTRIEVFLKRYPHRTDGPNEDELRNISRETQRANKVFESIQRGTFP